MFAGEIWRSVYVDLEADQELTAPVGAAIGISVGVVAGQIIGVGGFSWPNLTAQSGLAFAAILAGWLTFTLWMRLAAFVRYDTEQPVQADSFRSVALIGGVVGGWLNAVTSEIWTRVNAQGSGKVV